MIERFYLDNYKCFVNFEWQPKALQLVLGGNGTGKTTVFDVLETLREFIVTAVVNNLAMKKGEAVKLVRDNAESAYRKACDKVAESIEGATGDIVFAKMYPKIESAAKKEATHRDATKGLDFDLGDFTPDSE